MKISCIALVVALAATLTIFGCASSPSGSENGDRGFGQGPGGQMGSPLGDRGGPPQGSGPSSRGVASQSKTVSLEGKLAFVGKYPAIITATKTYIVSMPEFYYYAYTDDIREGASLSLEGYELPALPGQSKPYFRVTKAVMNGKSYEVAKVAADEGGPR